MATDFDKGYVQWVQRTLNRELDSELITDGVITMDYREAVETFQLTNNLAVTGKVDVPDQNRMIRANHERRSYVNWLQESLRAASVDENLSVTGTIDEKTKQCVRAFQSFNGLTDDGWVGAKTELRLIECTGLIPGGHVPGAGPIRRPPKYFNNPKPRPFVLPVENTVTRIINENYQDALHNKSGHSGQDGRVRFCVLSKLKQRHGIDDLYPCELWIANSYHGSSQRRTPASVLRSAREELKSTVQGWSADQRMDASRGRELITSLIKSIRSGLDSVKRYNSVFKESEHPHFRPMLNELTKTVEERQRDSRSILSCFR